MMTPSTGGCRVLTGHHLEPGKAFNGGTGLFLVEHLAKDILAIPEQSRLTDTGTEVISLTTDSGVPLLRTTFIPLIEITEVEMACAWNLHPYILGSFTWERTLPAANRETWTSTQSKNFHLPSVLPARCARAMVV